MKKLFICLISVSLVICMILPLASCTENPAYSNESESADESSEFESSTDESLESSEPDAFSTDSAESESEVYETYQFETQGPAPSFLENLPEGEGYTWQDSLIDIPERWNPHTYQTQYEYYPLQYITSGLYAFYYNDEVNYKTENGLAPFEGYVAVPEMAAAMPVDVTETVKVERPEFGIPYTANTGYAYKISLNPNATWQNGDKITADDYVYSMSQLLDPALNNFRASEYFSIANAEAYLRQGTIKYLDNGISNKHNIKNLIKGDDGNYYTKDGNAMYIAVYYNIIRCGCSLGNYVDEYKDTYFDMTDWEKLVAADCGNGLAPLNDETYAWLLTTITGNVAWGEKESDAFNYFVEAVDFEDNYAFSNVGLYKNSEYEIVIVFEEPMSGFELIDYLTENWLVYRPCYEACKLEQDGKIISRYGTSFETTVAYGPYKLTYYSKNQHIVFEKNESWYGYTDGKHIYVDPKDGKTYNMYETTSIVCSAIDYKVLLKELFLSGRLTSYQLTSDADFADYLNSDRVYFTPKATIFFIILNDKLDTIQDREATASFDTSTQDIETITLDSFRRALAVALDREAFTAAVTPSRTCAYGLIGSSYIYDLENGAKYRDTDEAKMALCQFYGVDISDFDSLDAAVESITDFNAEKAKELFTKAFYDAIEAGYITDSDGDGISDQTVTLEYASSATSEFMRRTLAFLNSELSRATEGTPFEGRIEVKESLPFGSGWIHPFENGMCDMILAGWSGDTLDPYALMHNYTDSKKQYDTNWFDASAVSLTLVVEGEKITMNLREWAQALNGIDVEFTYGCVIYTYNFKDSDAETKLNILAAMEEAIMCNYNYLPMLQDGTRSLLSRQVSYVTDSYCPVMEYGGLAYTRYNYNDSEWAEYVESCGGQIPY